MSELPHAEPLAAQVLDAAGVATLDALQLRLAAQIAPRSWRARLESLAVASEQGLALDEVFKRQQSELPSELRCLLAEALRVPDPTRLVLEALRVRERSRRNWWELLGVILYPTLLYVLALGVSLLFSFVMRTATDFNWIAEFGLPGAEQLEAGLDDQHHALLGLAIASVWVFIALATIAVAGPPWAWLAVMGGMVLIGRSFRWNALQEVLERLALFVSHNASTAEATDAAARSFAQSRQAVVARGVTQRVHSGMSLGSALASSLLSDHLCRPSLLALDARGMEMPQALRDTADIVGHLAEQRHRSLAHLLPLFLLSLVGTMVWTILYTYFTGLGPLVSMISSLA